MRTAKQWIERSRQQQSDGAWECGLFNKRDVEDIQLDAAIRAYNDVLNRLRSIPCSSQEPLKASIKSIESVRSALKYKLEKGM